MQISKEQVLRVLEEHLRKQRQARIGGRNPHPVTPPGDGVIPSLSRIRENIEHMPDVREDRIEPIERQLREGHYEVSDSEIAEKIVFRVAADTLIVEDEKSLG